MNHKICAFFGHKDFDGDEVLLARLEEEIERLIIDKDADMFYVGNQGGFDRFVYQTLVKISRKYPHIQYKVILAYAEHAARFPENEVLIPENIESSPPRYAIVHRNNWMLKKADRFITYIARDTGNAVKFVRKAAALGIPCVNIANSPR